MDESRVANFLEKIALPVGDLDAALAHGR